MDKLTIFVHRRLSSKWNKTKGEKRLPWAKHKIDYVRLSYRHSSGLCHKTFFFSSFFHQVTNFRPTDAGTFDYKRKIWKLLYQVIRNFNITFNVSQESSINSFLQETFFSQRTLRKNFFPAMIPDRRIKLRTDSINRSPIFLQFDSPFLECIVCALVLLPLLFSLFKICYTQGILFCSTGTEVRIESHSFKNIVTNIANSVYTGAINFLLSATSDVNLNSIIWSISLKFWKDHVPEWAPFVLAECESLTFTVVLQPNK